MHNFIILNKALSQYIILIIIFSLVLKIIIFLARVVKKIGREHRIEKETKAGRDGWNIRMKMMMEYKEIKITCKDFQYEHQ